MMSRMRLPFASVVRAFCRAGCDGGSTSSRMPVCSAASRRMTRTSSSIDRPWPAARRRMSFFSLSSSCRTVRLPMAGSVDITITSTALIALQSMLSQDPESDPKQQRGDDPQRRHGPAAAAAFGFVDLGQRLRRQYQTVARDLVELIEHAGATREQPRRAADETADFGHALRRAFELAGGAEMPRHPFAHDGLGGGPHVELGIERAPAAFDH